jgi:hypothetical protein
MTLVDKAMLIGMYVAATADIAIALGVWFLFFSMA